jgi:hypothetical protein
MASRQEIQRYRAHLADERHSAALYETLAHVEKDISRKLVFGDLARAAVLGANDGLVSNFCLIMGVASAGCPEASTRNLAFLLHTPKTMPRSQPSDPLLGTWRRNGS